MSEGDLARQNYLQIIQYKYQKLNEIKWKTFLD